MWLISFFLIIPVLAKGGLVSTTVGQAAKHIVTSREVILHQVISRVQAGKSDPLEKSALEIDSQTFARNVGSTLMDHALQKEAESLQAVSYEPREVSDLVDRALRRIKSDEDLKRFRFGEAEIRKAALCRLVAQKLLALKAENSTMPISDAEAKAYYEKNQSRFGNMPFENFRDAIKTYLTKSQVEARLSDWFDSLRTKYSVQDYLAQI